MYKLKVHVFHQIWILRNSQIKGCIKLISFETIAAWVLNCLLWKRNQNGFEIQKIRGGFNVFANELQAVQTNMILKAWLQRCNWVTWKKNHENILKQIMKQLSMCLMIPLFEWISRQCNTDHVGKLPM